VPPRRYAVEPSSLDVDDDDVELGEDEAFFDDSSSQRHDEDDAPIIH